jgi:hypothetical protein
MLVCLFGYLNWLLLLADGLENSSDLIQGVDPLLLELFESNETSLEQDNDFVPILQVFFVDAVTQLSLHFVMEVLFLLLREVVCLLVDFGCPDAQIVSTAAHLILDLVVLDKLFDPVTILRKGVSIP